jgi:hypothetical protein
MSSKSVTFSILAYPIFYVFFFQSFGKFDVLSWCLLGFLHKTIGEHDYVSIIEKAKNPNAPERGDNPNFIYTITVFQ